MIYSVIWSFSSPFVAIHCVHLPSLNQSFALSRRRALCTSLCWDSSVECYFEPTSCVLIARELQHGKLSWSFWTSTFSIFQYEDSYFQYFFSLFKFQSTRRNFRTWRDMSILENEWRTWGSEILGQFFIFPWCKYLSLSFAPS